MVLKLEPKCEECFSKDCKLILNPSLKEIELGNVKLTVIKEKNGDILSEDTFDLKEKDTLDLKQIKEKFTNKAHIVKFLHNFENKMDGGMFLPLALLNYFVTKIISKDLLKTVEAEENVDGTLNFTRFNFPLMDMVIEVAEKNGQKFEYDRMKREVVKDHKLLENIIKTHYLHECQGKEEIANNLEHLKKVFEHMVDDLDTLLLLKNVKGNFKHFKINDEFYEDEVTEKNKKILVDNIIEHYCKIYINRFSALVNDVDISEDVKEQRLSNFIIHIVHTYGKAFDEMFGKVLNYKTTMLKNVDDDIKIKIEDLGKDNSIRKAMTKLKLSKGELIYNEDEFKSITKDVNTALSKTPYSLFNTILPNIANYYLAKKPFLHLKKIKDKIERTDSEENGDEIKKLIKEYNTCVESFRKFTLSIFVDKNVSRWLHISKRANEENNKANKMFFKTLLQISEIVYVFNDEKKSLVYPFFKCIFGNYKDMLRVLNDLFIDTLVKMNNNVENYLDYTETKYLIRVFNKSGEEIEYENVELNSKNFMLMSCKNCT